MRFVNCIIAILTVGFVAAHAQTEPTYKKATIDGVTVIPPKGKKKGKIGKIEITKLLHQYESPTFSSTIGLTGKGNDDGAVELVLMHSGLPKPVRVYINDWTVDDVTNAAWYYITGNNNSMLIGASFYGSDYDPENPNDIDGDGEADFEVTWYYVASDFDEGTDVCDYERIPSYSNVQTSYLSPYCDEIDRNNDYYMAVADGGTSLLCKEVIDNESTGYSKMVQLANGNVIHFDRSFSRVFTSDCKLFGAIVYDIDSYDGSEREDYNRDCPPSQYDCRTEYYLIDPNTGLSTPLNQRGTH